MRKLKILLIPALFFPHYGGLETVVSELSYQFISFGHDVAIITNQYPRKLPHTEKVNGISVIRFPMIFPRISYIRAKQVSLFFAGLVLFPVTFIRLILFFWKFKPDIVNVHYVGRQGIFVLLLSYIYKFRLIVSLHGGDVDSEPHKNYFNRWIFKAILNRANVVTACSSALLRQAVTLVPEIAEKARVIHNGIDVELFLNSPPFQNTQSYILGVGKLVPHKGFDVLVDAFMHLAEDNNEIELLIAGTGTMQTALQARVEAKGLSNRVRFLGRKSHKEIASLMRGASVIAIPSRREPFGIVGLEAMAAGRPIIATAVGGLPEALQGAEVFWITPDDVDSLIEGLRAVLENNELLKLAETNRQHSETSSWAKVAENYLAIFLAVHNPAHCAEEWN